MSILVQYLKFLRSSPGENEKKEKTAELPGYAPSVAGSMDNEKKDEDKLTSSITDHGLAAQETPKNINVASVKPVAMRSSSSAAAPAFTQPVANPGRGHNAGAPSPQVQQQPTKIPRVLERIPKANSVTDPRSGTLLDKQGSLGYSRNTGIADTEGEIYINSSDVELLGKLGFEVEDYDGLEKTSEVLDVYSYIEKVAGIPKEVAKLVDAGQAFSGEYLKDMGYNVPKGYEVKGDLCCPVEKTGSVEKESASKPGLWANIHAKRKRGEKAAAPTQQYEGESTRPFGGSMGGMSGGIGLQRQSTTENNQPALRPTPPQLRPMPAQEAPKPVNPAPGSPMGVTNTSPTMSPGTGQVISTHAPLNVNNVPLGQVKAPSWSEVYSKMKTRPIDFVVGATDIGANLVSPGGRRVLRTLDIMRQGLEADQTLTQNKPTTKLNAIDNIGGVVAGIPSLPAKVVGTGMQLGAKGLRLAGDYDQARAQLPDILKEQPVVPPSNYPPTYIPVREEQQQAPTNINIDSQLAKNSEFTRFVKYFNKTAAADHPLKSSNIKAVGHDKKEKVLEVAFHSGSEYMYKDVPRSLYDRLLKAKSPGKFFNKHIKKNKPFEYEKVAGIPEHIRRAIAAGDKALLQAAQSRSAASRVANTAAKKRKLEVAKLLGNEEPKLLQHGEEFQKHFPFSVSHEFEQAKKTVDPAYKLDMTKYLGKPKA
jgi:hypothetical protein